MPLSAPVPLGVGTPEVEALSGYVQRLAAYQGSFPGQLLHRLLAHKAAGDDTYLGRWRRRTGLLRLPSNMNGFGHVNAWLKTLNQIFEQQDLWLLTTIPWEKAFPCRHVLSHWLRYCPQCLQEDPIPYHRLLWCMDVARVCCRHKSALIEFCPRCARRIPVIHPRSNIVCCPWCAESLLATNSEPPSPVSLDDHSFWVADEVGRLLSASTGRGKPQSLSGAALRRLCRARNIPHATALGAAVGTSKITAWYWWNDKAVPSLPMALRICRCLGIHLIDAVFGRPRKPAMKLAEPVQLDLHLSGRPTARKLPWPDIRAKLLQEISRPLAEARSLLALSRELKIDTRNLRAHEPELCRKISRRYVEAITLAADVKYKRLCEQIAAACETLRKRGHRPNSASVAKELGQPGLFCRPTARRALAEVLRLDYRNWPKTVTVPGWQG